MAADSFSSLLRLRLQATGNNPNTWGSNLNAAVARMLEDAIAGVANITVAGVDITLSTANGATDQARMAILNLTGAPGGTRNIIVPNLTKFYFVINSTGNDQVVKCAATAGITVANGSKTILLCDGTTVQQVQAGAIGTVTNSLQLGGVVAANYARLDIANIFQKRNSSPFVTLTDGATVTLDSSLGNQFVVTLGGNRTLSITNPVDGHVLELWVKQDATGGRSLTFPGDVEFESGSSATLTATANAITRFQLTYNTANTKWICRSGAATSASATTLNLTGTIVNANVFKLAGSPAGVVTINVNIAAGAKVLSLGPGEPALDFSPGSWTAGCTFNLINLGQIVGHGGKGARGGTAWRIGSVDTHHRGVNGGSGGNAISGPGAGHTFNVTNADGNIWGGGGGGGGGGVSTDNGNNLANGGGGGGGAGCGDYGEGGNLVDVEGLGITAASNGSPGSMATFGGGGAGTETGSADGGNGGAGGDFGSAGAAGDSPTGFSRDSPGGSGGGGGKAIELNGGTVSFVSGSGSPNVKGVVS